MGIFGLFGKKPTLPKAKVQFYQNENGFLVDLGSCKPNSDNNIDLDVLQKIKEEIQPLEEVVIGFATAITKDKNVDDKIEILECLIASYGDLWEKCRSMGQPYVEYMEETWETQKKDGLIYIDRYKKQLCELKKNYKEIKETEDARNKNTVGLEDKIVEFIDENAPILQTEVYKSFDPSVKKDIQEILYFLEQNGKIKREKSKNTYVIFKA